MNHYEITEQVTGVDKFGRETTVAVLTHNGVRVCVLQATPEFTDPKTLATTYKHVGRGWNYKGPDCSWASDYAPGIASGSGIGTFDGIPTDLHLLERGLADLERNLV